MRTHKKMKQIVAMLFSIAIITLLFACNKESSRIKEEINQNPNTLYRTSEECTKRHFTDEQINWIADNHNAILETVFNNFDFSSDNKEAELHNQFSQLDLQGDTVNWAEVKGYEETFNMLKEQLSSNAYSYIEQAFTLSSDIEDVAEFNQIISTMQMEAKSALIGCELDCVLTTLEVFKKSAYFWLPEELGGSGKGTLILQQLHPNTTFQARWKWPGWNTVLASDAGSAGIGCLVVAFSGGVGLLPMVASAAGSSALTALNAGRI